MRAALWWSVDLSITFYHERGFKTMDTNQIAEAVQRGEAAPLALWEAVQRFSHDQAYRWYKATEGRAGMVLEDFLQVSFLAVLDALEGWDPDKGAFLTWYALKLKSSFTEAAGQRTKRGKCDPLQNCVSLDMPLTDSEDEALYLGDVLPDPEAEEAIENVAERDRLHRLRDTLHLALQTLPTTQRRVVVLRYCYGLTPDEIAARMNTTRAAIKVAEQKGIRLLRHPTHNTTKRKSPASPPGEPYKGRGGKDRWDRRKHPA